ncbi:MAG TPA: hypothetical protein VF035_01420 [Longimicrobiales bacterium]
MRSASILCAACALLLATSCTRDDANRVPSGSDTSSTSVSGSTTDGGDSATQPASRPATLVDSISIEGSKEPMTLTLVESPAGFPMTFSTYMPPDMQVEFDADSAAVKFIAAFGGTVQPKAFVQVQRVGEGGVENVRADSVVGRMLAGRTLGNTQLLSGAPPWASDGAGFTYTEEGARYNGTIAIRGGGDNPFRIVIHMLSEYADGMSPRVQMILENWRWADGSSLIP